MNRIKELRLQKNISQDKLAKSLNVHQTAVSQWEKGRTSPDSQLLTTIAEYFDVSVDYLLGRTNTPSCTNNISSFLPNITEDFTTFPIIGNVAAGYDYIAYENFEGESIDVPNSYLKGRKKEDFFVLKVKGDSMFPLYQNDDKVLILKQSALNYSGQVGVVLYGDDNATLKKVEFKSGEDWMRLVAINPNYPPTLIENESLEHCRILGIPRMLIREFDE